jgi:autotransporter translocation and assembly factor TamB
MSRPGRAPGKQALQAAGGFALLAWLAANSGLAAAEKGKKPEMGSPPKEAVVTQHARGAFEVKLTMQPMAVNLDADALGRMSIEKQFHGDLEGTSKGEMLTASTDVKGSAGYVAVERFNGTLSGRQGTFALQHSGTMTRGAPQLSVTVVPDSGTGQLVGLAGRMSIDIADGKHSYDFEYTLPKAD